MENHDKLTIAEMAEKLNRTYLSVAHKRRDLGLSPDPKRKKPLRGGFDASKIDEYRDKFEVGHIK